MLLTLRRRIVLDTSTLFGIKLIGGGLDEAPFAYKDIHEVMNAQNQLVETMGLFYPKIVRMDGAVPKQWRKGRSEEILGE